MNQHELTAAGFELSDAEHARLTKFAELLLDENTRVNLTGARDAATLWGAHLCDSLALLPLVEEAQPQSLLDLGSGGGLPGVPLACVCPELRVTLLDSTRKKLDAVARIAAAIELENLTTLWGRAEVLAHQAAQRERYDVVTVRAVGGLRTIIELAAGFVRPGGQCWLFRSCHGLEEEIEAAQRAASRCRLSLLETRVYSLPEPHGERAFVIYHKDRELLKSLPRQAGRPKSDPL